MHKLLKKLNNMKFEKKKKGLIKQSQLWWII